MKMSSTIQNQFTESQEIISILQVQGISSDPQIMSTPKAKTISIKVPEFKIGDMVYYNLPNTEYEGIVLSIRYILDTDEYEYYISWGPDDVNWYSELEIALDKLIA